MASQTQGIQQLLAAEKRAAEKVAEARKRKLKVFYFILFICDLNRKFYIMLEDKCFISVIDCAFM